MADSVGGGKPAQPDPVNDQPWYAGHEAEAVFDIGGEKLTLKQMQDGYLRQADYTRKTQELAEQRKQLEAPQVKPEPQKPGNYPSDDNGWGEWSRKVYDFLGPDPAKFMDKVNEISVSNARDLLTNYELSREVDQALEASPRFVEIFGEDARDTLWDRYMADLAKNGNVKAKEVCARLLANIPTPEVKPDDKNKSKLNPERGAAPVGPKKDLPALVDKRGNLTTDGFKARMDEAIKAGKIPDPDA
jgi:hypothetical protein